MHSFGTKVWVDGFDIQWFLIDEYAPALGSCQHVFDCFFPRYFRSKLSMQHLRKGAHGGNRNPLWLGKTFYPDERPNWLCKGMLTVFDMLARFQKASSDYHCQNSIAAQIIIIPALTSTKISILLLYRRIFPSRKFHIVLYCVGGFNLLFCIATIFAALFRCIPIKANWEPEIPSHCTNVGLIIMLSAIVNVSTDIVILCLPMPILWKLHASRTRKFQLTVMFMMGGL